MAEENNKNENQKTSQILADLLDRDRLDRSCWYFCWRNDV